mmetsp:Transcript_144666/g.252162  ORF Transcript_144666/g.252162 Transcript_144666/m.252162 type:complete len:130 (-) Transcript_144666:71-460(-)
MGTDLQILHPDCLQCSSGCLQCGSATTFLVIMPSVTYKWVGKRLWCGFRRTLNVGGAGTELRMEKGLHMAPEPVDDNLTHWVFSLLDCCYQHHCIDGVFRPVSKAVFRIFCSLERKKGAPHTCNFISGW